jgi:aminoglycoside phosphotransferase (APT) family kinase protein
VTETEERISRDLAARIGQPVVAVRAVPEGHSGFTYWVEMAGGRAVLRLPPPGARIAGPADIPRQARIMAALHGQGLPVPAVLAGSEDPVVDGRPFVLTEALPGERVDEAIASGRTPVELASAALEVLRRLQAVPLERTGIGDDEPMPLQGELARWAWLMERAPSELTGRAPELARRLNQRQPPEAAPVMVHGDYHFGNMLFTGGRVSAVLDWEIAQLGQPLLDLCCICLSHVGPDEVLEISETDPLTFRWFLALTRYKYAAILGYNLMLHRRGKRPDPSYEERTDAIRGFIEEGIAALA